MKKLILILLSATVVFTLMSGCKDSTTSKSINLATMNAEGAKTENNVVKITNGGTYEISGGNDDCMIYVDTDSRVNLELKGINIKNPAGPAIYVNDAEKVTITLADGTKNYIEDGKSYVTEEYDAALFSNDNIEITGSGSLDIKANCMHGIASDDGLTISNGKITVNSYEHGIKSNDMLCIKSGEIAVTSEIGKCIKADEGIVIDGGKIDLTSISDEGMESDGTITINDGDVKISSKDDGINTSLTDEEKEAAEEKEKQFKMPKEEIPHDFRPDKKPDGEKKPQTPKGTPPVDFFNKTDEKTAQAHALTIKGGKVYIKTEGDGIDSNGALTISGGEVIIDGPEGYDNGSLDSDGEMIISGGTVLTSSSNGMMQLPRESKLCTARIELPEKTKANTKIEIKSKDGKLIYEHTPELSFELVSFISDKLIEGEEYKVYLNGTQLSTFIASREMFFRKRP